MADEEALNVDEYKKNEVLLSCLSIIMRCYGYPFSKESLLSGLPVSDGKLTPELLIRSAEKVGFSAKIQKRSVNQIPSLVTPAILLLKNSDACVLTEIDHDAGKAKVIYPDDEKSFSEIDIEVLSEQYTGYVIYIREKHRYDKRIPGRLDISSEHWFWGTILSSWKIYRDVLLASFLINCFVVVSPLFVMNVYDKVVPNLTFETLWALAIGAFIVFSFDLILRLMRGFFIDIAGKKSDILLSARIMERVLGASLASRPMSVGAFAKNIQEFESVRDLIASSTVTMAVDLPFTFLILFVIYIIGGSVVLIPITGILLIVLYSYLIQKPLRESIEKTVRSNSQKNAVLIEGLSSLEVLKVVQGESEVQRKWEESVGHIAKWGVKTRLITNSAGSVASYVQQLTNISMVILGVYLIADGELSMGGLIASVMLSGRCMAPMAQISNLSTRFNQAQSALLSMNQIMAMPLERQDDRDYVSRPNLRGRIEFEKVNFNYPGSENLTLKDVSFEIKSGEKVAIIGRIGSGKTTIEKMMLGLYEPNDGSIRVDGVDLRQINPTDLRSNIGCVPQDINLFYGTIKDNITMGVNYVEDHRLLEVAKIAGVSEFADKNPNGLDLIVGERGQNISGGQRQSIAIARALITDPPVMVLDEPTSAMDNTSERRLKQQLQENCQDKTIVLITHKASMLDLVDRLIVIDNGRIVADGPKEQVHAALKQGKLKIE